MASPFAIMPFRRAASVHCVLFYYSNLGHMVSKRSVSNRIASFDARFYLLPLRGVDDVKRSALEQDCFCTNSELRILPASIIGRPRKPVEIVRVYLRNGPDSTRAGVAARTRTISTCLCTIWVCVHIGTNVGVALARHVCANASASLIFPLPIDDSSRFACVQGRAMRARSPPELLGSGPCSYN